MSNATKNFDILAISLSVLLNYFDDLTKLFSYLAKFLDILPKTFFPCANENYAKIEVRIIYLKIEKHVKEETLKTDLFF